MIEGERDGFASETDSFIERGVGPVFETIFVCIPFSGESARPSPVDMYWSARASVHPYTVGLCTGPQ